jgi:hypothetical protein
MKNKYDYIASVEKAVAEKYGKQAVQDFRNEWSPEKEKEYLDQLAAANKSSFTAKAKEDRTTNTDRQCPLCKTYSFSSKDDLYMNRFQCCYLCYNDFIEHEEDRWNSGWRPSADHLKEAKRRRK